MIAPNGSQSRILVTGGTGFVGRHLIEFLRPSGAQIAVLASGARVERESLVRYYEVDIRDATQVSALVHTFCPTHVYHLAGISSVGESWNNPRLTFEVNVEGTYNLFEAVMGLSSPGRILNVSTSQVYARSCGTLDEDSPLNPESPYAATKAAAELLRVAYSRCPGAIITARPFNHTGPGQPATFVVSSIVKQFAEIQLGLRPPIISVGNVHVRRDFTDVRDIVRAYRSLLDMGTNGEVYNVCSGSAVLLTEIIEMCQMHVESDITIETDADRVRSNEPEQILGNPEKIRRQTGWYPQIQLQKTIADIFEYWQSQCLEFTK